MRRKWRPRSVTTGSVALFASWVGPRPVSVSGGLCALAWKQTGPGMAWLGVQGGDGAGT